MVETYLTSIDQLFSDKRDLSTLELRFRSALVELYDGTQLHISEDMLAHFSDAVQAIKQGKSAHIEIDEDLVTAERAGEILGVSRQTIYNWQDKGRLRKIMQGCRRMTSSAEVREIHGSLSRS
jgi:predicted DNA-binding transcriptional regulator AlpA